MNVRMNRRRFLTAAATLPTVAWPLASRLTFAQSAAVGDARFVFVLLRGALDGLAAVPPWGDPAYASLRRELAIPRPGEAGGALPLDATFGLHPSLPFLHEAWQAKELLVAHAVATPYRERSHFDGQDVLEGGGVRPHELATGWLNRALAALPRKGASHGREAGITLGQNTPLTMRGPAAVASWAPSRLATLDDDTLARITDLYAADPVLSMRLADALAANDIAQGDAMPERARGAARYTETVRAAGAFLARDDGPAVAMFDTTGWDTHANEGGARGLLATRLGALDAALRELKSSLAARWSRTVVVLATEFGRTVARNGTNGTDHGTGAAAFLVGGAVAGGRMLADWPGLDARSLRDGRDLAPTLDLRAVLKGVLHDHLGVATSALDGSVFPGSAHVQASSGLIRA
ncbi:MAG: hypothetical protein NAOJABEB_00893 [Steroidobacteraceae bacterium]|nr:hypothetical protein [Steroidobacteraceae bacterium]